MFGGSLDFLMRLIWQTTLVLVAVGLLIMAGLVLRRLFEEWRHRRYRPARERLRRELLTSLNRRANGPAAAEAADVVDAAGNGLPPGETARLVDELAQIVRGEARQRLAAFASAAGVERLWLRRLRSRFGLRRIDAVRCLALFETPAVRQALQTCLAGKDVAMRLAAAEALAQDPATAEGLVRRLAREPAAFSRQAARLWHRLAATAPAALVRHLAEAGAAGAAEATPGDTRLLVRLIEALSEVGHLAAAAPIEALVGRQDPTVDQAALRALDRLNHPAVMRAARALTGAADAASRRAALAVLAQRAKAGDVALVTGLLQDPLPDIAALARTIVTRLSADTAAGASPA